MRMQYQSYFVLSVENVKPFCVDSDTNRDVGLAAQFLQDKNISIR